LFDSSAVCSIRLLFVQFVWSFNSSVRSIHLCFDKSSKAPKLPYLTTHDISPNSRTSTELFRSPSQAPAQCRTRVPSPSKPPKHTSTVCTVVLIPRRAPRKRPQKLVVLGSWLEWCSTWLLVYSTGSGLQIQSTLSFQEPLYYIFFSFQRLVRCLQRMKSAAVSDPSTAVPEIANYRQMGRFSCFIYITLQ
jgi:hypothetical protein